MLKQTLYFTAVAACWIGIFGTALMALVAFEHEATVVGRTFEDEPRYDLRLANGDMLANIKYISKPLDVRL
jgi:hypothetical protein